MAAKARKSTAPRAPKPSRAGRAAAESTAALASHPWRQFVIVGSARTGTSFIADSLLRHEDVLMHGEPFQSDNLDWHIREEVRDEIDLSLRDSDPIAFIDSVFARSADRAIVGCKILNGQNDTAQAHVLDRPDVAKIYTRRPNALAAFSSFLMARETNVWNLQWPIDLTGTKVKFVREAFWDFLVWQTNRDFNLGRAMSRDPANWLLVTYDSQDMKSRLDDVLGFLRLDPSRMIISDYVRLNTSVILDRFSNPDEVEAMLGDIGHPEWREE
jgi:hypothetical protein